MILVVSSVGDFELFWKPFLLVNERRMALELASDAQRVSRQLRLQSGEPEDRSLTRHMGRVLRRNIMTITQVRTTSCSLAWLMRSKIAAISLLSPS